MATTTLSLMGIPRGGQEAIGPKEEAVPTATGGSRYVRHMRRRGVALIVLLALFGL